MDYKFYKLGDVLVRVSIDEDGNKREAYVYKKGGLFKKSSFKRDDSFLLNLADSIIDVVELSEAEAREFM